MISVIILNMDLNYKIYFINNLIIYKIIGSLFNYNNFIIIIVLFIHLWMIDELPPLHIP
jgi:hypothetical protein